MNPGEVIAEEKALRLIRQDGRHATLCHGDESLLRLELRPSWHALDPVRTARLALDAMRPHAPKFLPDETGSDGFFGGLYFCPRDEIRLCDSHRLTPHEVAGVIVHEVCHSTGHPIRLARPCFNFAESNTQLDAKEFAKPSPPFEQLPPTLQREELTAALATAMICPRLGIWPCGSALWPVFFERASVLPLPALRAAVADAQAACGYVLNE